MNEPYDIRQLGHTMNRLAEADIFYAHEVLAGTTQMGGLPECHGCLFQAKCSDGMRIGRQDSSVVSRR